MLWLDDVQDELWSAMLPLAINDSSEWLTVEMI